LPGQGQIDAGNPEHSRTINSSTAIVMQGGNSRREKQWESPSGHVIARIRPLKGDQLQGGQKNRRSLGNPKEYR
jgi:hypothetical protein